MRLIRHGFLTALVSLAFIGCGSDDDEPATKDLNQTIDEAIAHYPDLAPRELRRRAHGSRGAGRRGGSVPPPIRAKRRSAPRATPGSRLASRTCRRRCSASTTARSTTPTTAPKASSTPGRSTRRTSTTSWATKTAGIVNDPEHRNRRRDPLEGLNEEGAARTTSLPATTPIEFLLWGQDLSEDGSPAPARTPTTLTGDQGTAMRTQDRRRAIPRARCPRCSASTSSDAGRRLGRRHEDNYRAEFEALDRDEDAFSNILTGMIVLSGFETGGERLPDRARHGRARRTSTPASATTPTATWSRTCAACRTCGSAATRISTATR